MGESGSRNIATVSNAIDKKNEIFFFFYLTIQKPLVNLKSNFLCVCEM